MIFYELQTGFCGQENLILEINVMYLVDEKLNVVKYNKVYESIFLYCLGF